ncbi:MAG TPA: VWA domain-containing protein [Candidatus Krumholzibacteria bacterium]|nr:VWA domain-containing protein [Candidatus Krumholzibacteria bacterium]HRX51715.1 VWA domain-containing protein [Candidatus Krumholzibacteria bacterium]
MLEFAEPRWLLLVLPMLAAAILLRRRDADPATLRHPAAAVLAGAPRSWRVRLRAALPALRVVVLLLVVIGIAGPRLPHSVEEVEGEGIDIVVALDISGSMQALDFQPDNRLQVAKRLIRDFVNERPRDRIGLTVFASRAFTQCPLTLDRSILEGFLDEVQIGLIEDGTAIGLGLATAVNRLRHSEAASRTVILLTDGSNNVPTMEPETAAELAQALGVRVYTIGVGKRGRVPFPRQGPFGTRTVMVEMPIDEDLLTRIAEMTGGRFWRAEDPEALAQVFAAIDELETSRYKTKVSTWYDEKVAWAAAPALALLLLEALLGAIWLRRLP